ncbi:MAG: MMPL family transporter [Alphaproteobacteria bacterium]
MKNIFEHILKRPKLIVSIFILLSISLSFYIYKNLKINVSTDSLINQDLDFKIDQKILKEKFPTLNNNILMRVKVLDNSDHKEINKNLLEKIGSLRSTSFIYSPSFDEVMKNNFFLFLSDSEKERVIQKLYFYQPFISKINQNENKLKGLNELINLALKNDSGDLESFEQIFKNFSESLNSKSNVNWKQILASDSNEFFIIFGIDKDYLKKIGFSEIYNDLRSISNSFESNTQIDYTGGLIIDYEEISSVSSGAFISGVLSFILVALLLWILFRDAYVIFSILITIIVGLILTLGVTTKFIGSLNLISVAFAVLFIGLSVDFGIQICSRVFEDKFLFKAHSEKIIGVFKTLLMASIPAIVGFLSFIPTDYIGLSELGIISAIGLVLGLFINTTLLPCLLSKKLNKSLKIYSPTIFRNYSLFLNRIKIVTLTCFLAITVYCIIYLPVISFDADALNLKDQKLPSVKLAKEIIEKNPASDYVISVIVPKNSEMKKKEYSYLLNNENIKTIFSFSDIINKYESDDLDYLNFLLSNDFLEQNNSEENQLDRLVFLLDDFSSKTKIMNENQSANRLKTSILNLRSEKYSDIQIEKMLFSGFVELIVFINNLNLIPPNFSDNVPMFFKNKYISKDGDKRIEVYPRKDLTEPKNLENFVLTVQSYFPNATGMPVIQYKAGQVVVDSFLKAFTISIIFLLIFLFIVFKKFKLVILCLSSLMCAFILTTFSMLIFNLNLNFANMISLPLLFTLGVCYSVYFLKRFQELKTLDSIFNSNTPTAILFSGLTTISSFGTLYISQHEGTSSMGLLLFISLSTTLLSSLVFLPIMIKLFNIK